MRTEMSSSHTNITSYSNLHQPKNFQFPQRKLTGHNRSFQAAWLDLYSWLHYNEQHDSVICFYCPQQSTHGNLSCTTKKIKCLSQMDFATEKSP